MARNLPPEHFSQANRTRRRYDKWSAGAGKDFVTSPLEGQDVGKVYAERGWAGQHSPMTQPARTGTDSEGHLVAQEQPQLPGMGSVYEAQTQHWEEMTRSQRQRVEEAVRTKHGIGMEDMVRHIGAQVDKAYTASEPGRHPAGLDFYTDGEPARVMRRTAVEQGVDHGVVTALNAATSPNMVFKHVFSDGRTVYPNNDAAVRALDAARAGVAPEDAVYPKGETSQPRPANFQKAVKFAHHALAGEPITQWRGLPSASNPEGPQAFAGGSPKTAAYHNAWHPEIPATWVSDVHSGASLIFPHESASKGTSHHPIDIHPVKGKVEGGVRVVKENRSQKSEQENALAGTKGMHAMIDYAARRVMGERGLTSVREVQAAQWNHMRQQKIESGSMRAWTSHDVVGPPISADEPRPRSVDPNQGELFTHFRGKEIPTAHADIF